MESKLIYLDIFELIGMPRETIEILMGIKLVGNHRPRFKPRFQAIYHAPRIIMFIMLKLRFSKRLESFIIKQKNFYDKYWNSDIESLDKQEILTDGGNVPAWLVFYR